MFIFPTTINSPRQTARRGSVALVALVALVVVLTIALGLLTLGSNVRLSGKRAMRLNGAQAMATAGVEYGYWQRVYNGQTLPFTVARSLGGGRFTVTVTDNSASTAGTIQIVSTGTQSGDSVKLTRILPVKKTVFDYALCSNSSLSSSQVVTTGASSANGDVRANGNISLTTNGTIVNGDATSTGSINIKSTTGMKTPNSTAIAFPTISAASYQNIVATYGTGQAFSGTFALPPPNSSGIDPVVMINGDATLNNVIISGVGTIVVNGNLTFLGSLTCPNSTAKIAILCTGSIINAAPVGTAVEIDAFCYLHNSTNTASFQQTNTAALTVKGGLTSDSCAISGPLVSIHDSYMNATHGSQMQLPGY